MCAKVIYLHYGPQCYGYQYMGKQAEVAAKLLNMEFEIVNIERNPEKAKKFKAYSPGTIVIDDFNIGYPGKPEELVESFRRRGPLEGVHLYQPLAPARPEKIKLLLESIAQGCTICWSSFDCSEKAEWMKQKEEQLGFPVGLIAFVDNQPVAALEWVKESDIPYPIPRKRDDALFITCVYNKPGAKYDYRHALVDGMKAMALDNGYKWISVIAGFETPYPNGPKSFFESCGFVEGESLGRLLLRYRWDDIAFMECELSTNKLQGLTERGSYRLLND